MLGEKRKEYKRKKKRDGKGKEKKREYDNIIESTKKSTVFLSIGEFSVNLQCEK